MPIRVAAVAYTHYESDPRVRREAEALADRGDRVEVFCLASERFGPGSQEEEGVLVHRLAIPRYRGNQASTYARSYSAFWALTQWRLNQAHFSQSFDLVHVHTLPDVMVSAALLPRLSGARVLLDMHDLTPPLYALKFGLSEGSLPVRGLRWLQNAAVAFADAVICVHGAQYELLLRDGVPTEKLWVLMNLPDPKLFVPVASPMELAPEEPIRLVYHGTVLHRYGVDLMVQAFAEAKKSQPLLQLEIIGGGDFVGGVQTLAQELGLKEPDFTMTGEHRPLAETVARIRHGHLGIVPNRDDQEDSVLPTKLMEYLALGVPTIASKTRSIERFFPGDEVALFPVGDASALAEQILRLSQDLVARQALVAAGQRWTEQNGWLQERKKLYRLCDRLLER